MTRSKIVEIIEQEIESLILEQQGIKPFHILAACAFFATRYIKDKEQQQLPQTMVSSTSMQAGDRFIKGGKSSKPEKTKISSDGSIVWSRVTVGHSGGESERTTERKFLTKQNEMNSMLYALDNLLMYAKAGSSSYDKQNKFVKKILLAAKRLSQASPGQYDLKKLSLIGQKTQVIMDSKIESNTLSDVDSKEASKSSSTGRRLKDFLITTTVKYLSGPLATKSPGSFAGMEAKVSSHHLKYVRSFGSKGLLGALRDQSAPSSLGGSGVFDQSTADFKKQLDKATS